MERLEQEKDEKRKRRRDVPSDRIIDRDKKENVIKKRKLL